VTKAAIKNNRGLKMSVNYCMKLASACAATMLSLGAMAVPLTNVVVSGPSLTYLPNPPGTTPCGVGMVCLNVSTPTNIGLALSGAGNVELNKFGGMLTPGTPVTTLTGTFGVSGPSITLSSLVLTDWTANSNALASAYIMDAATAASLFLTPGDLINALFAFYAPNATLGGMAPWMLVSDPNISYVNNDGGIVSIGMDGLFDASLFLNALNPAAPDQGAQVSEVVKVTYNGVTDYLYGFHATPTGYMSDQYGSQSGNYEVTIPEPEALWLLGIGLVGLLVSRRR
jgi:hypothetical protein